MTRLQKLWCLLLVVVMVATMSPFALAADEEIPMTWEEYVAQNDIGSWNWNDAANAIEVVANHAVDLYASGDMEGAYEYAKATYWGYYETTGFERNTMTYISGSRVSAVELQFSAFRKAVKKDTGAENVAAEGQKLVDMLKEDALILSPEGSEMDVSSGSSAGGATATFIGSLAIIVREGLEAILIVGAIIAYLVKTGNKKGVTAVYIGSVFAIICSFAMAALLSYLKRINPENAMSQEIVEGIAALTAVVVLIWVSNWMVSKSESAAWTAYIEDKAATGDSKGSMFTLGFTAWLAVFREGAEVILFYQPLLSEEHANMVWAGFGVGVVILVIVFLAIRFWSVRLPIKPFFMGTSILMAIMSISFLGAGIKELIEGGVINAAYHDWFPLTDTLDVLGIYPLYETLIPQAILLVITIITFILHVKKNNRLKAEAEAKKSAEA